MSEQTTGEMVPSCVKGGPGNLLKVVSCVPFSHPEDQEPAIYIFTFSDGSAWELNTYDESWLCLWGNNASGLFQGPGWKDEIK